MITDHQIVRDYFFLSHELKIERNFALLKNMLTDAPPEEHHEANIQGRKLLNQNCFINFGRTILTSCE